MLNVGLKRMVQNKRSPAEEQHPHSVDALLDAMAARLGASAHSDVKDLDTRLRHLIADQENSNLVPGQHPINPRDITVEYILRERRQRLYPKIRYKIHSPYGGYDHSGVRSITREELKAIAESVEARMANFVT